MRRVGICATLCALVLLAGCAAKAPAPTPAAGLAPSPPPTAEAAPGPAATAQPAPSPGPEDDYTRCYLEDIGATLLLPKSWEGNYVIEGREASGEFRFAQKDFLSGEWGVREDGTEGPVPDPDGSHVTLVRFIPIPAEEFTADPAAFSDTGPAQSLMLWLGERDGVHYTLRFPTSFSAGDSDRAEEKQALYQILCADIETYPENASACFIFDEAD